MKVSIVIRCMNEAQHIGKLLKGISVQTYQDVEVIVVDSGSTDDTLDIAREFPVKIVEILPEDFSFGYALNMGCAAATGDILLFASAHVYPVRKDWVAEMTRPFQKENVAVVYGRQVGNELTKYSEHQLFARWFPKNSNWNQRTPFSNNANCAIRRDLWQAYPYDESLTGLEDLAWAKHILTEGYRIVYNADAPIVHVHEETPKRIYNRYRREAIALKHILPTQKFSFFDFVKLFYSNTLNDYYHALRDGKLLANLWDIPMFRYNQFWGTYKGYRHRGDVNAQLRNRFYYPNRKVRAGIDEDRTDLIIDYNDL